MSFLSGVTRRLMPKRYARLEEARRLEAAAAAEEEVVAEPKQYDQDEFARSKLSNEDFTKMKKYEARKIELNDEKDTIEPLLYKEGVSEEERRETEERIYTIVGDIERINRAMIPINEILYAPPKKNAPLKKGGKKQKAKKTKNNKSNIGRRTRHRK
jgi:hypothetical protein